MPTSRTPSTPKPSSPLVQPPKICPLLPLPSTNAPIPTLVLPPPRSDFELPPRYYNTAGTTDSFVSLLRTFTHFGVFAPSALSASVPSPRVNVTDIGHHARAVDLVRDETWIGSSDRNPNCTPEGSSPRRSPSSIHYELRLPSLTQNVIILSLPSSCFDTYYLPCNSHTSHLQDSSPSSPTTSTYINNVPRLIPPSSLPSFPDDVPELYLPAALREW